MPYFLTLQKFVQALNKLTRLFALACVLNLFDEAQVCLNFFKVTPVFSNNQPL